MDFAKFSARMALQLSCRQNFLNSLPEEIQNHILQIVKIKEKEEEAKIESQIFFNNGKVPGFTILEQNDEGIFIGIMWPNLPSAMRHWAGLLFYHGYLYELTISYMKSHTKRRIPKWLPFVVQHELSKTFGRQRITFLNYPIEGRMYKKIILGCQPFIMKNEATSRKNIWAAWTPHPAEYLKIFQGQNFEFWIEKDCPNMKKRDTK